MRQGRWGKNNFFLILYNRRVRYRYIHILGVAMLFFAFFSFFWMPLARASQLSYVSDTISDSRPLLPINHEIVFQTTSGIPASGRIVIAFKGGQFLIDPLFGASDIDLSVSTSSPHADFTERTLASVPDDVNDGVAVTSTMGPITITLSSGSGIPAGAYVRILLGTNAPDGLYQITNPSSTASYSILLNTYNDVGGPIDYGVAMIAILPGVGVDANTNGSVPILFNGLPSGTIPSNAGIVLVSFNTKTYATCKYAMSPGIAYDLMLNLTTDYLSKTFHTFSVGGIVRGNTYTYYVRCSDFAGNENLSDYVISFYAGDPTGSGTGGGTASGGSSGGGGGGGDTGAPYIAPPSAPALVVSGVAMPNANLTILEDGSAISVPASTDGNGNFSVTIPSLPQGTYSFTVEARGSGSSVISSYTATISLISGTTNTITGVVLPPSILFVTSTVAMEKPFLISGLAEPSSTVDIVIISQTTGVSTLEATTTVDGSGVWSYPFSTAGLPMGTYQVKAQDLFGELAMSNFSSISLLGIGEAPAGNLKTGDLNGDGKINLADFSILLYHWGTDYPLAEFDGKNKVDLTDLSIMLSHWTG